MYKKNSPPEISKTWITNVTKGKKVLEIGGLGDFVEYMKSDLNTWQHVIVRNQAESVTGIDIDRSNLDLARERGFDYHFGDIEDAATLPIDTFDIVLMSDVIEHLNNVGLALVNMKNLLTSDGALVITTPSPWALNNIGRALLGRKPNVFNDHTNYMVKEHFEQLAKRFGYKIIKTTYFSMRDTRTLKNRLGSWAIRNAGQINPVLHSHIWIELGKD